MGTVELTFAIPGIEILTMHYQIAGNGFSRSGDVDVSAPNAAVTALVSGIPAGTGYAVTIDGMSTDGRMTCEGSGTFDIIAAMTTLATVQIICRTNLGRGDVAINGMFRLCPAIGTVTGNVVNGPIATQEVMEFRAMVTDPENDPLTFMWTATAGTFDSPSAMNTIYRCAAPGSVTLTLRVSDGGCEQVMMAGFVCRAPCAGRAAGTLCNDDNACTRLDTCQGGQCVGSDPVVCAALDQCHLAGVCSPADGSCSSPIAPDGSLCQLPGANAACQAGTCEITACLSGFGDCNTAGGDGCETRLNTDASCGACFRACTSGTHCDGAGRCLSPAPAGVAAVAGGWKNTLTWNASPGGTSYEVRRAPAFTGSFQVVGTTASTRFVDLRVLGATPYSYAVAAINAEGTGPASAAVTVTTANKQLCVNSNPQSAVLAYGADQSGAATPVRTIGGSFTALSFPDAVASSLQTDELFVIRRGTLLHVYPLAASGGVTPTRVLTVPTPAAVTLALDVDGVSGRVYKADYQPAGRLLIMDASSGAVTRTISGANTGFGNVASLVVDAVHGEILTGVSNGTLSLVETFDIVGPDGDVTPKRVLGAAANTAVGSFAIALDRSRDQILTSCNCDNRITVFGRTAVGDAVPTRALLLPAGTQAVYSLFMDEAADTVWAVTRMDATTHALMELPRGGNGNVAALHPPITFPNPGRIAACN